LDPLLLPPAPEAPGKPWALLLLLAVVVVLLEVAATIP
jgi:hypothetical protein